MNSIKSIQLSMLVSPHHLFPIQKWQDTVIGLQALAAYAGILSSEPLKMRVELMVRSRKLRQFELLEKNKLVMQEMDLSVPNMYTIRARGKGCGLIQVCLHHWWIWGGGRLMSCMLMSHLLVIYSPFCLCGACLFPRPWINA